MPMFYIKREFYEALMRGRKKAEIRVGEQWVKVAEKIKNCQIKPLAIFKWSNKIILRKIYKVEIFPSIRRALANGRWRLLGLRAKTYTEAIAEVSKLYSRGAKGPSVFFWLSRLKKSEIDDAIKYAKKEISDEDLFVSV